MSSVWYPEKTITILVYPAFSLMVILKSLSGYR